MVLGKVYSCKTLLQCMSFQCSSVRKGGWRWKVSHLIESVPNSRVGVRYGHCQIVSQSSHQNFRVSLWYVDKMKGQLNGVVEVMSRCRVHIWGLQEVRWRRASVRLVKGKDSRYKVFWVRNDKGMGRVGISLAEKWIKVRGSHPPKKFAIFSSLKAL